MFSASRLTVYTDRENALLCLLVLARHIKGMKTDVVVADPKPDTWIGKILRQFASVRICDHDLSDYTNINKENLFIERERLLEKTTRHFMTAAGFGNHDTLPLTCRNSGQMDACLSRYVVDEWGHLYAAQLLIAFEYLSKAGEENLLFLRRTPQSDYFQTLLVENFRPVFYYSASTFLKSFGYILKAIRVLVFARGNNASASSKKMAVQYVQGTVHQGYGTDFDFLPHSGLSGEDIVYLLDGDDSLTDRDRAFLSDQHISAVHMHKFSVRQVNKSFAVDVFKSLIPLVFGLSGRLADRFYLCGFLALFGTISAKFLTIFSQHGISAFLNVADTNLDALPKMLALEHLGGVDLSFEFSATGYHAYMDCRPLGYHQYLAWGTVTQEMIQTCQKKLPYPILPQFIYHAGNLRFHLPMTDSQRQEISSMRKGTGHTILILDALDTHLKLLSRKRRQAFYDAIISLINDRPDDAFIIKPQGDMPLRLDQKEDIERFCMSGRVVLVRQPGLMHPFLPLCDLIIGTPIYASSVFEALSARKVAVCFDNSDWPHMMREKLPACLLAFDSMELKQKVDVILSGRLSVQDINNMKDLFASIDPFGDMNGVVRLGQYVGGWLRAIKAHGGADEALLNIERFIPLESYRGGKVL